MMMDFADIRSARKEEQIRAWALEQAIDSTDRPGEIYETSMIIKRAEEFEKFVRDGGQTDE